MRDVITRYRRYSGFYLLKRCQCQSRSASAAAAQTFTLGASAPALCVARSPVASAVFDTRETSGGVTADGGRDERELMALSRTMIGIYLFYIIVHVDLILQRLICSCLCLFAKFTLKFGLTDSLVSPSVSLTDQTICLLLLLLMTFVTLSPVLYPELQPSIIFLSSPSVINRPRIVEDSRKVFIISCRPVLLDESGLDDLTVLRAFSPTFRRPPSQLNLIQPILVDPQPL